MLLLAGVSTPLWLAIAAPVLALVIALLILRILRRQVLALGYLEREEDFIVRSGVMWRKQVVIPYGRMQYVEVNSGPLERRFGLCQLTLNTAGAGATAHVYGLPAEQGQALRERLVSAGEEKCCEQQRHMATGAPGQPLCSWLAGHRWFALHLLAEHR
ncbi:PH domain-containing protein [Glutamicibacter sp. M10]|uniref:PH domain-containing protein n=1 Tax=Glutamicibacter sp. M10 TaxID=3023076 RepID=UPI0021C7FFBE|nr:PH domain-containing protein [Glutamicibacter sp. M10]UXN32321.1 PH domain-containing protein [Glutamicibacter sp. M10]